MGEMIWRQIGREWSFPRYLAHRRAVWEAAWTDLDGAGRGPRHTAGRGGWITLSPGGYPAVLDLVEQAAPELPFRERVWEVLAPRWHTLRGFGLVAPSRSRPRWDDVHGGEDFAMR